MADDHLQALRARFGGDAESVIHDPHFAAVAGRVIDRTTGKRIAPYAGFPTLLDAPARVIDWSAPDFGGLDVALLGMPMDLGITNRNGCRFGPRALRGIERVGPYNHALKVAPVFEMAVADVGDVPFRSRYDLSGSHDDIERAVAAIIGQNVIPLSVGGDHSISLPILRAIGAKHGPVAMVHIDAHCDTSGPFEGCRFHHGGPFRQAVLEGALDPRHTIQIGIRGSSEFLWEFSYASGMTVIHAEEIGRIGLDGIVEAARVAVGDRPVYVSFDIDSLDPAFAPGTGTPEIGGLTTREAQTILRGLAGLPIIGGDVVEVAPQYDATTNTAHAGAQILFEILSLLAVNASPSR
ncbi:agmatinase [Mongoliimonas terrestris]|uniref:agmatinase n=1 Tax=Mongoliimonas terrestris TaxID=1709001 RepID=UPI00094963B9|nr:agmatinase [Mongoliimonas terrestris]